MNCLSDLYIDQAIKKYGRGEMKEIIEFIIFSYFCNRIIIPIELNERIKIGAI